LSILLKKFFGSFECFRRSPMMGHNGIAIVEPNNEKFVGHNTSSSVGGISVDRSEKPWAGRPCMKLCVGSLAQSSEPGRFSILREHTV
jgi:hypothetical protein